MVSKKASSPSDMPSSIGQLSRSQLNSLLRLGDLYIPGTSRLPSFSQSECIQHLDVVLDELHPDDIRVVRMLLMVLRFVPTWMLRRLLSMTDRHDQYPEWIGCPLRLISLAFKGLVMSLYYSGLPVDGSQSRISQSIDSQSIDFQSTSVLDTIGYQLHCEMDSMDV